MVIQRPDRIGILIIMVVLVAVIVVSNFATVISDTSFAFGQFVGDDVLARLAQANSELVQGGHTTIFVVSGSEAALTTYVEYWRNLIGAFVPDALVYVGRVNDLLRFQPPEFTNPRIQVFASRYWTELVARVKSADELHNATIVVIEGLYPPLTAWELRFNLLKVSDGIYVVSNYTAQNGVLLVGATDYTSIIGPWYTIARDWASSGLVLEIYGNVTSSDRAIFQFTIDKAGNYSMGVVFLDDNIGYVPVSVQIDGLPVLLIQYGGTHLSKESFSSIFYLDAGNHSISVAPETAGPLFLDLDYILLTGQ